MTRRDLNRKCFDFWVYGHHGVAEEGWGRLKASAAIGKAKWDSAIWYDTKAGSYILPLKASVRKETGLGVGAKVKVQICIAPVNPVLKKFFKSQSPKDSF